MRYNKIRRVRKTGIHDVKIYKVDSGIYAWTKPYNDPEIEDVFTGLGKQFNYSPIFKKPIVDTMVELTGYRRKDYIIAENQTGIKHTPRVTVWHHAWEEKGGLYKMQLVDFEKHKKTCPHAGGCKLWIINTKKRFKYAVYKRSTVTGDYNDIADFYSIEKNERSYYQKGYVSKRTLSCVKRKKLSLVGIDMYGNLLYEGEKGRYFWDHENDCLISLVNLK